MGINSLNLILCSWYHQVWMKRPGVCSLFTTINKRSNPAQVKASSRSQQQLSQGVAATVTQSSVGEAATAISAVNTDKFASSLRESKEVASASAAVVGRDVSVVGDHHRRQSSQQQRQQQQQQARKTS